MRLAEGSTVVGVCRAEKEDEEPAEDALPENDSAAEASVLPENAPAMSETVLPENDPNPDENG